MVVHDIPESEEVILEGKGFEVPIRLDRFRAEGKKATYAVEVLEDGIREYITVSDVTIQITTLNLTNPVDLFHALIEELGIQHYGYLPLPNGYRGSVSKLLAELKPETVKRPGIFERRVFSNNSEFYFLQLDVFSYMVFSTPSDLNDYKRTYEEEHATDFDEWQEHISRNKLKIMTAVI